MTYEDKPTPGIGHLLYLAASAVLLFAGLYFELKRGSLPEQTFQYVLAGLVLVVFFLLAWSIYGAYRTVYRLDNENLELRRGRSVKIVVLENIESILLVGVNWPALGLGFRSKDYCNRLTDGIRLVTTQGKFYISPTNSHLFANHIRNMRFAGPPPPEFPPDEQSKPGGDSA